jgi:hypothetical protein
MVQESDEYSGLNRLNQPNHPLSRSCGTPQAWWYPATVVPLGLLAAGVRMADVAKTAWLTGSPGSSQSFQQFLETRLVVQAQFDLVQAWFGAS